MHGPHFNSVCLEYLRSVPHHLCGGSRLKLFLGFLPQIKVQSTELGGFFTGEPTANLSRLYTGCLATLQR